MRLVGAGTVPDKPQSTAIAAIMQSARTQWWQRAVVYEIALASFQDSDGDGRGDLGGLLRRLDHLSWLGVDVVWLTPVQPSPFRDFGYDISDYCAIDPSFGTMEQFDRLVSEVHARGMRLILDFVPNHTATEHPWFVESRASRGSARRDWYVWADPGEDGGPPNNWLSRFGGSAWTWDEPTGQYYYHSFLQEQPDLNWRTEGVRRAMADVLRFWLRRGVDGFRVDASAVLVEDALLRDDPPDPEVDESLPPPQRLKRIFTDDRPQSLECLEELHGVVDEFDARLLAGEVQGKLDRIGNFYKGEQPRFHLPLNFALLDTPWDALSLQANIDAYFNAIPDDAWPCWVIGGHDKRRVASKVGQSGARLMAMLALTLRGTPFLFAGDELGMEQAPVAPGRCDDPFEKLVPGYELNRDPERAPMRWDEGPRGGFTTGEPWLPQDDRSRNVASLTHDSHSILHLWRALIALRRQEPALTEGTHEPMRARNDILAFGRRHGDSAILVLLNLSRDPRRWPALPGKLLLSSHLDRKRDLPTDCPLLLRGEEGLIIKRLTDG
jgi:alpha-glucosidase